MTEERRIDHFAELLDALGADTGRWPERDAEEARRLLASSPRARAHHEEAKRLARLVAEAAHADTPNGFAFRIVADVASRRSDDLGWLFGSPRRLGVAGASFCAAALAIGVALGAITQPAQADTADLDLGGAFSLTLSDGDI